MNRASFIRFWMTALGLGAVVKIAPEPSGDSRSVLVSEPGMEPVERVVTAGYLNADMPTTSSTVTGTTVAYTDSATATWIDLSGQRVQGTLT